MNRDLQPSLKVDAWRGTLFSLQVVSVSCKRQPIYLFAEGVYYQRVSVCRKHEPIYQFPEGVYYQRVSVLRKHEPIHQFFEGVCHKPVEVSYESQLIYEFLEGVEPKFYISSIFTRYFPSSLENSRNKI